jgi:hypothetical protein
MIRLPWRGQCGRAGAGCACAAAALRCRCAALLRSSCKELIFPKRAACKLLPVWDLDRIAWLRDKEASPL